MRLCNVVHVCSVLLHLQESDQRYVRGREGPRGCKRRANTDRDMIIN